jgi:TFIIF-interacting CTD phosphatase-like protein
VLGRKLEDMIIVDNLIYSFSLQIENGIPILAFVDDMGDGELGKLGDILVGIRKTQDARDFIRLNFRLNCLYNFFNRTIKGIRKLEINK